MNFTSKSGYKKLQDTSNVTDIFILTNLVSMITILY